MSRQIERAWGKDGEHNLRPAIYDFPQEFLDRIPDLIGIAMEQSDLITPGTENSLTGGKTQKSPRILEFFLPGKKNLRVQIDCKGTFSSIYMFGIGLPPEIRKLILVAPPFQGVSPYSSAIGICKIVGKEVMGLSETGEENDIALAALDTLGSIMRARDVRFELKRVVYDSATDQNEWVILNDGNIDIGSRLFPDETAYPDVPQYPEIVQGYIDAMSWILGDRFRFSPKNASMTIVDFVSDSGDTTMTTTFEELVVLYGQGVSAIERAENLRIEFLDGDDGGRFVAGVCMRSGKNVDGYFDFTHGGEYAPLDIRMDGVEGTLLQVVPAAFGEKGIIYLFSDDLFPHPLLVTLDETVGASLKVFAPAKGDTEERQGYKGLVALGDLEKDRTISFSSGGNRPDSRGRATVRISLQDESNTIGIYINGTVNNRRVDCLLRVKIDEFKRADLLSRALFNPTSFGEIVTSITFGTRPQ
jgi:hypothetical protein